MARFSRLQLLPAVALLTLASSGCAILDKQVLRQLQQMQASQIAHSRLMVFAVVCVMLLPLGVWAGHAWKTRQFSLRSLFVLMAVESVLLGAFAAVRAWFD